MEIILRLPESLGKNLKAFAKREKISMNQLIATAIAEKLSAMETYDYLQERAERGDAAHLKSMLSLIPEREPEDFDKKNH